MSHDAERAVRYWDRAAGAYVASRQDGPLALSSIYEPVIDDLLGDVKDKRVLDVGCGDGYYARKLAATGAAVLAIDGSAEMIKLALRDTPGGEVEYRVADLTQPLPLPDRRFDVVLANMVLMDIPTLDVALAEVARVVTDGAVLVFSVTHPAFFCSDWVHDAQGAKLHKAVSDYLSPTIEELGFWGPMPSAEAVARHGDWQHHRRIPSFIVVRARMLRSATTVD